MPRTSRTGGGLREEGSASLVMIGLVTVAATLVAMLGAVGVVAATNARAQGAADACAIAAAYEARDLRALGHLNGGTGDPCASAGAVADEWGVSLESCSVSRSGDVTVTVAARSVAGTVRRSARAGT